MIYYYKLEKCKNMNEQFCTPEISMELKKLGFDEPCFGYYKNGKFRPSFNLNDFMTSRWLVFNVSSDLEEQDCTSPHYQIVIDWLLKKHNLHCVPIYSYNDYKKWSYDIIDLSCVEDSDNSIYLPLVDSGLNLHCELSDARIEVILKSIEIIKKKTTLN